MHPADRIVARLAVERGLVAPERMQSVVAELERSDGGHDKPSLASIMHQRGLVNDSQMRALVKEQSLRLRVIEQFSVIRRADKALGEHLMREGVVQKPHLLECFYVQDSEREEGRVKRLGDILIARGAIEREGLMEALRALGVASLRCPLCGASFQADANPSPAPMTCPVCAGPLVDEDTLASMRRGEDLPQDVRIAEQFADRVYGKFVLVQHLGTGGMGSVWKAWDRELSRYVAIKILRTVQDPIKHDEDVRRFVREATTVARLRHPNIVSVYEAGDIKQQHCIVMEYVDGKPLNHLRLPLRRAMEVMRDAARAVQYAHDQGVVHRDLKPGNIMVTPAGQAFVMDFGLARSLSAPSTLTQSGYVLGTPMYMPPEQAQAARDRDEKRCDVYALGATLYDLLTGRPPFDAEEPWDVIAELLHSEPIAPRRRNPEIPKDAETIVLKAMQKEVWRRYESPGALADDIDRFLKGETIVARPMAARARAWRAVKRHRPAAIATAAVLLATVTAVAAVLSHRAGLSRRIEGRASALVERARAALSAYRSLRAEHFVLRAKLDEGAASGTERLPQEARLREIDVGLNDRFTEGVTDCHAALELVGDHADARRVLGDLFWERLLLAEERGEADLRTFATMVRLYAGDRYGSQIDGEARLTLTARPAGAEVTYARFEEQPDGRLAPGAWRRLGRTPLERVALPRGSWLLVIRLDGYADVRLPVLARRGEEQSHEVRLCRPEDIPEGFVYIPAGKFISGGDPMASRGLGRREVQLDGYFIGLHEVTTAEFLEFLAAQDAKAHQFVPRRLGGTPVYAWDEEKKLYLLPSGYATMPSDAMSYSVAQAFCEWKSRSGPFRFRLPTSLEWEKAARGVDGRAYPWGNVFDWSFTWGGQSEDRPPMCALPVGTRPFDESPYGVRDMAGNLSEWCQDPGRPAGTRVVRGGDYTLDLGERFRCAGRGWGEEFLSLAGMGFRLVAVRDE